jgi:hypothetical protein
MLGFLRRKNEDKQVKKFVSSSNKIKKIYKGSTLLYSAEPEVLFESNTPGTYIVNIPYDGNYEVICVGGGSGSSSHWGGSGAGFVGVLSLVKGSYTIIVAPDLNGNSLSPTPTTAFGIIAGTSTRQDSVNGVGGVLNITNANVVSYTLATNGQNGSKKYIGTEKVKLKTREIYRNGATGVYGGYGYGGPTTKGTGGASRGGAGYVKISEI